MLYLQHNGWPGGCAQHFDCVMHQATPEVGARSLPYDTSLPEPVVTITKHAASLFMDPALAAHIFIQTAKDVTGTIVVSDSDYPEPKPQLLLKSIVRSISDTRREIEAVLGDFGIVMESNVETIVENHSKDWRN